MIYSVGRRKFSKVFTLWSNTVRSIFRKIAMFLPRLKVRKKHYLVDYGGNPGLK